MDTMSNDKPLPDDINDYPPAAFGAGAPQQSYAKYTKLRSGAFGVRVPGGATPGMWVDVRTNAGAIRRERIHHVLWTGADKYTGETIALCTVEGASVPRQQPAPQRPSPQPSPNQRQRMPIKPAAKPKRPGRQPMPRIAVDDGHDNRDLSDATQARVARIDDDRAEAERALGKDEPLF